MTEAQIRVMDDNLTTLSRNVAEARAIYTKEKKEADAAEKVQDERFHVSEILAGSSRTRRIRRRRRRSKPI